ncbi:MAG TPA: YciI family protein [Acidimicrobiia bacterium]|nr:YciI family protein [Acidimicrobiia bacterium]
MGQYLLSTYRVEGEVPGSPQGPEEMQSFMGRVIALEEEMQSSGSFVFGGALRESDTASVVHVGDVVVTDGPFAEAKEQIAGFYVINAEDDDEARAWARRVADATNHPIEIRPFAATGLVKDMAV